MTVGNVSSGIDFLSGHGNQINAMGNIVSQGMTAQNASMIPDFSKVMYSMNQNTTTIDATNTGKNSAMDNLKNAENRSYEEHYRSRNTVKDKATRQDVSQDNREELKVELKDAVKNVLSVDDEELERAMAELGITFADLLNPSNVVNLVAKLNEVPVEAIVMDENLSAELTDLLNQLDATLEAFALDNQLDVEDVVDAMMEEMTNASETEENVVPEDKEALFQTDEQVKTAVVVDSQSGKEIKITMERNTTTSEEVTMQPQAKDVDTSKEAAKNESGQKEFSNQESLAEQFIQTLTDSVQDAVANLNEVNAFTTVNPADVIQQMIDAIKVNVSNEIQSMEIQLNPESLGKLNLTVMAKDGVITASITAQNEAVKNALEAQLISLKNDLSNAGLKVDQVEVSVASHEFNASMMNQNDQNPSEQNAKSNARRRFRGADEIPGDDVTQETPNVLQDGESINVTA